MFEIVNVQNGMVIAEIAERDLALKWAARWADENDFDCVEINDDEKLVTVEKLGGLLNRS
jgi:hypothetical protein